MDRAYRVLSVQRRDEWKSKYARDDAPDMVDYAVALEGEDGWIKLSQKITTRPPQDGQELFGHIEDQHFGDKSYRKFKKGSQGQGGGGQGVSGEKVEYIIQMLEELTGRRKVADVATAVEEDPFDDPFKGL